MHRGSLINLAVTTFALTFVFAYAAGAQETTTENEDGEATEAQVETPQQPMIFAEGEQTEQTAEAARAEAQQPGPLAGTRVETISTDAGREVEIMTIARPDCTVKEGASD